MLITILSILMTAGCLFLMIAGCWLLAGIGETILRKAFDKIWEVHNHE